MIPVKLTRAMLRVGCSVAALSAFGTSLVHAQLPAPIRNASGVQLVVSAQHTDPVLRLILPGQPASDNSVQVLFPEHVTAVERGSSAARQLYIFRPGRQGDLPRWYSTANYVEYERELEAGLHLRARATLDDDGVLFRYEFSNRTRRVYDMIYAVTDPRLTMAFHDPRLERTYVHHPEGFELLASETPARIAASAASHPLFEVPGDERSTACSCVLQVMTPNAIGKRVSHDTRESSLVTCAEMKSKCGVSPRITALRQMIASWRFCRASSRATMGSSHDPGTLMISGFSPPVRASASIAARCSGAAALRQRAIARRPTGRWRRWGPSTRVRDGASRGRRR